MSLSTTNNALYSNTKISKLSTQCLTAWRNINEIEKYKNNYYITVSTSTTYYLNFYSVYTRAISAYGYITAIRDDKSFIEKIGNINPHFGIYKFGNIWKDYVCLKSFILFIFCSFYLIFYSFYSSFVHFIHLFCPSFAHFIHHWIILVIFSCFFLRF